jgi:hypothetical protein
MFQEIGERLDDWLNEQNIRRIRVLRRLGLLPKPTPAQIALAEDWARAAEHWMRFRPLIEETLGPRSAWDVPPVEGKTITFRKWGDLTPRG